MDQQPKGHSTHNTNEPVKGGQSRREIRKGNADGLHQPQQLFHSICASGQTVGRTQFKKGPADKQIRDIGKNVLSDLICRHGSPPAHAPWAGAVHGRAAPKPV